MQLPNLEAAIVPKEKIVDYLLSLIHPKGRTKAQFFIQFGFSPQEWQTLADAFINHAKAYAIVKIEKTHFGDAYVIEGSLQTPSGRTPNVRVIWFIDNGQEKPRLATAYPLESKD